MINYEVKGGVARILATENLIVEHKQCDTAQFNVHTRVLTLPMWEKASESVFDLLVAHEVGHALYTPDIDWIQDRKIPPQFVNVTEDARIEKLMKRRYAGLPKTFFAGYKDMHEDDFFAIANDDISKMNLADRANLYFKVGNFVDIKFTPEELEIVNMIGDAETFDDALDAAEALYQYCKKDKVAHKVDIRMDNAMQESGGGDFIDMEPSDEKLESNGEGQSIESSGDQSMTDGDTDEPIDDGEPMGESSKGVGGKTEETPKENKEPEVRTDDILQRNLKDLIDTKKKDNLYLEFPNFDIEKFVAPNKEIHSYIVEEYSKMNSISHYGESPFTAADKRYQEYKTESAKEVGYLVKEFECKKAADSYARASTARTGVLDCSKLHTYKYNDDLFKKVTTIPDGKNHGLVFILDWSGSMSKVMLQTLKQLYSLLQFCKKCNIPFDVYAFTQNWTFRDPNQKLYPLVESNMRIEQDFTLMNLFTSSVNGRELENQMKNIWRVVYSFDHWTLYPCPSRLSLSGTPLCETMICLKKILPAFQKKHNVQKVNCVVLTDGEGNPLQYHTYIQKSWIDPDTKQKGGYWGVRNVYYAESNVYLRNRSTGKVYQFGKRGPYNHQDTLITALQDEFPNVNFIGFRILESGHDAGRFINLYADYERSKALMEVWKKERSFTITESPYNKYFGIAQNSMDNQTDFLSQLNDGATKTEIRNAMKKTLSSKKSNKKLLNEFVQLIA